MSFKWLSAAPQIVSAEHVFVDDITPPAEQIHRHEPVVRQLAYIQQLRWRHRQHHPAQLVRLVLQLVDFGGGDWLALGARCADMRFEFSLFRWKYAGFQRHLVGLSGGNFLYDEAVANGVIDAQGLKVNARSGHKGNGIYPAGAVLGHGSKVGAVNDAVREQPLQHRLNLHEGDHQSVTEMAVHAGQVLESDFLGLERIAAEGAVRIADPDGLIVFGLLGPSGIEPIRCIVGTTFLGLRPSRATTGEKTE